MLKLLFSFYLRVLAESLRTDTTNTTVNSDNGSAAVVQQQNIDLNAFAVAGGLSYDLQRALEISREDEERRELLRRQEDEELERILKLSLVEK